MPMSLPPPREHRALGRVQRGKVESELLRKVIVAALVEFDEEFSGEPFTCLEGFVTGSGEVLDKIQCGRFAFI